MYYIVLAGILLLRFREQALEMFCEAVIMSYAVNIMYGFAKIGVGGVLQYLATMAYVIGTGFNTYFEMHDLGLSVELLIIYQLFMREKTQWLTTSLLALVMVFCYKRIAIFAMIVTMIFYVFIRRKGVFTRDVKVYGTFIAILAACFIYTWFIASDVILELAARYGFDFSNRIGIFGAIRNFYEWSVFFLGHGLYFTRSHFQETYRLGITGLAGLHNDILTTYVDLGFIGSFLWFFYQLWIFPKSLEKHFGHETSFVWCILMVYAYCVYTTDNTQTYSMFQTFIDAILMLQIMKHSGFISAKSAS
ncbi:MAG: hypothetical protein IJT02_04780 [Synergistaceae bacterium]|nr:hypothetical protein [Synergistaceae bacterium]